MSIQTLALAFLAATAIGGLAWVFIYPLLSGERKAESRRASIARSDAPARQAEKTQRSRREQVEGSLKELDARRKKEKSVPLTTRLAQAGLGSWTPQKFWIVSGISGAVGFVLAFVIGGSPLGAAVMAFGTGLGLPRWVLGFLKKRREKGVSEGAARRRRRHRARHQGRSAAVRIDQGGGSRCTRAAQERVQRHHRNPDHRHAARRGLRAAVSSGCRCRRRTSSASWSRSSRSRAATCRKRSATSPRCCATARRWREKIQAMSTEAKASAGIIGSLPPIVMLLVWISTPDYIALLWTHPIGQFMLVCCVGWMTIGILVMKKMINFDF
jgi:tight adherence protein B